MSKLDFLKAALAGDVMALLDQTGLTFPGVGVDKMTLIVRNPMVDEMYIVVTNDDLGEVADLIRREVAKDDA